MLKQEQKDNLSQMEHDIQEELLVRIWNWKMDYEYIKTMTGVSKETLRQFARGVKRTYNKTRVETIWRLYRFLLNKK